MNIETESRSAPQLQLKLAMTAVDILLTYPDDISGLLVKGGIGTARESLKEHMEKRLPLHRLSSQTTEEQLSGCIDTQQTLATGKLVNQEGLLSRFSNDALLINVTQAMPVALSRHLSDAMDTLASSEMPRLVIFDESGEDSAGVADSSLAERLPMHIYAPAVTVAELNQAWLVRAQEKDARQQHFTPLPSQLMRSVSLDDALLGEVVKLCLQLGIVSYRAVSHCVRIARAHAAMQGRSEATEQDIALAVQLTLAPRAILLPDMTPPEPAESINKDAMESDSTPPESGADDNEKQKTPPQDSPSHSPGSSDEMSSSEEPDQAIDERLIEAAKAVLPEKLLNNLASRTARMRRSTSPTSVGRGEAFFTGGTRGRASGVRRSRTRGRGEKVDILETIKSSIPYQRIRQIEANGNNATEALSSGKLSIRSSDIRITTFRQTARTTTVFVVDASGSTAMQRLAEAKGAVELLLGECYIRRDRVALITFRATQATLDLPPTRSLTRAKRVLNGLPGGGGTPLASGIQLATELVRQLRQAGEIPVVVFMTDASANIALDGRPSRMEATLDAEQQAKQIAAFGIRMLFIDTSPRPRPQAQRLAHAMRANYLPLPRVNAQLLPNILRASA